MDNKTRRDGRGGWAAAGLVALLFAVLFLSAFSVRADDTKVMYRLYNPNSGEHFYTSADYERQFLRAKGWCYEGIGWVAPADSEYPVYRLYNPNAGDHHYTMSEAERDMLTSIGWNDEGIGWYSDAAETVPLYRQYNPNAKTGTHNYTTSLAENNHLASLGWREEGVGWYALEKGWRPDDADPPVTPAPKPTATPVPTATPTPEPTPEPDPEPTPIPPSVPSDPNKVIYLTFDDGPSQYTARLLDILDEYGVKATFFVTNQFPSSRSMIGEEARRGHTVAVHTLSHDYAAIYRSESAFWSDIEQMNEIIRQQTGSRATLLRFPGGTSNSISRRYSSGIMTRIVSSVADKGYRYCDWNVDSGDAVGNRSTSGVAEQVIAGISGKKTAYVLQHDIYGYSVEAVPAIIEWGRANGYTFLPITAGSPLNHHPVNN